MFRSPSRTTADRPRAAARALAAVLALAAAAPAAASHPWGFPYEAGDGVRFEGAVADVSGRALAGVEVALEASTPRFDWRRLTSAPRVERQTATSDERGAFALEWSWDPAFRRFELVATLAEELAGRTLRHELVRVDVTDRVKTGSPVAASLAIADGRFVERARAFLAAVATDDERRIWTELGLPESVDRLESPSGVEAAWWYYAAGRVARFRDGRLIELQSFDPIRPLGEGEAP
jgi:hypothetical protein